MEDIHFKFQNYLLTFEPLTPKESFQKEIELYNLSIQKVYSIVYEFINYQLQEILQLMTSNSKFDYQQLLSLSNVLLLINRNYLKKLEAIVLSKCKNIFDSCLEMLELIAKMDQVEYSKADLINLMIVIIEEVMKPYSNDLYLYTNSQRYLNILVASLSGYSRVRDFLMLLIHSNNNRDIYNYLIKHIANFFEGIKQLMLTMSFEEITTETASIALQFKSNFKDIAMEFEAFINFILAKSKDKQTEKELKVFFSSLFNIIQDEKAICYGIGNMLLQIYEDHINEPEICQPIISSFFNEISGEYYVRLLQNTDLIRKFISKLYNQRNQETIAFFFYFLNLLSFSFETSENEVYIPKIEFKTIIESIQYFTHNEQTLKFIFERLMSLFDQKAALGIYFLEECDYFVQIKTILSMNNNISMLVLEFTEQLFKKNFTNKIWEEARRSNVFYFDTIKTLDPLMLKIIWINLTYERIPEKYYEKAHNITGYLYQLPIISQQTNKEDNCSDFLVLLRILLQSISQITSSVIYKVKYSLFTDIATLIHYFLLLIADRPLLLNNLLIVFDLVFSFIFQFNRSMASYKFTNSNRKEEDTMIHSPVLFSKKILKEYLKEVLVKLTEDGSRNLLCFLFKKCIQYNNDDHDSNDELFNTNTLNPIDYCLKAFQIHSLQSSSKYSTLLINSHLIIQCLLSAVFNTNSLANKLSLITYLGLLCRINEQNNGILLRGKIIKRVLKCFGIDKKIDDQILALLNSLTLYFNKEDLIEYVKYIYVLLVKERNVALSKQLFNIIEMNQPVSLLNTPSITLSPLNSHHCGTYSMLLLDNQQTKVNTIYVYYTLFIPSLEALSYFTLGQFVSCDNTIHVYFDKENLHMAYNKQITRIDKFNEKITSFNKWYTVLIQPGTEFAATMSHASIIIITYPKQYLFEHDEPNKQFDFAAGYVYLKEITKRNDQLQLVYSESNPYINISYLVISNEEIRDSAVSENGSVKDYLNPKLSNISTNAIVAEVFFDKYSLVNCQSLANLMYKMTDSYDLDPTKTELLVKIPCNDGLKGYNDMYLFKNCNLLDYAALNEVFALDTLNKDYLLNLLFRFNSYLHITLNDSFIADLLLLIMQNAEKDIFFEIYESIFRVILAVNGEFQLMFFERHMSNIKILLAKYAEGFEVNFVPLFIYNKYVDINEGLQYEFISNIFFYPHLYANLKYEVKKKINTEFEKFLNYYENNEEVDYAKMKVILVNLWNLFIHYDIDTCIPPGEESLVNSLIECIQLLKSIIFTGKESHNELGQLSSIAHLFNNTFTEYEALKQKSKKNKITNLPFLLSEAIERQISLMKLLLKDLVLYNSTNGNGLKGVLSSYLSQHFLLEFDVFKNKIKYEKIKRALNKHIQLLFLDLRNKDKYSWYLDKKEGNARMRVKMVFKENNNSNCNEESDKEDQQSINNMFKQLSLYDSYSDISMIKCMIDEADKYHHSFISLLIERMYETASLIVLGENAMYLYTNVICDKNKKIYLFSTASTRAFWARNDIDDEWENLVGRGKDTNDNQEDKNILINHKSKRIEIKTLPYKEISELHKRRYMHQNNSLELFLMNGSNYFITVFPKVRDELFTKILTNINHMSTKSKIANLSKSTIQTIVYLKHYPIIIHRSKLTKKAELPQRKTVIEIKSILADVSEKWSQCFISNFNYIMILNTLSGRTYNDMSQYFIFPWILKDFFSSSFCLKEEAYFRDLAYPTHAQTKASRANLKAKISNSLINHNAEACHSGVFLSNLTQISYYLLRLKPFTEVSLEIHGGHFDSSDRLFTTMKLFCEMKNLSQEWIPEIVYLPELLINMNNYSFGKKKELLEDITYNDVVLPPWAKNDPRHFSQIMLKAIEAPKVSDNLHNWIDLLFGYKMPFGKLNFEYFNRYLSLCYFFEDLKGRKYDKNKLNEMLFQTKEFGSNPLQIVLKNHIQKKEGSIFSFLPFFGTNARIENCVLNAMKSPCIIRSSKIGDMRGLYESPKQNVNNGEGGLSSLSMYIDQSIDEFNEEEGKLARKYFIVGKNKSLMGQSFTSILSHNKTSIYISKPLYNHIFEFNLGKQDRITASASSLNGKFIVIGLSKGTIIKYQKRINHSEEVIIPSSLEAKEVIPKPIDQANSNNSKVINPKILFVDNNNGIFSDFAEIDNSSSVKFSKKELKVYYLIEVNSSSYSTSPIVKLCLCESYSFLLAIDEQRTIYLYDFNKLKLRYKFNLNKSSKVSYSIKHVKVINKNCDFLIATKYSLHLYSINGLPILNADLFQANQYFGRSPITAIEAIALFDTLIFTGHADGSVYISKLITETPNESPKDSINNTKQERVLYEEYHQRYNMFYTNLNLNKMHSQQRKLSLMKKILTTSKKIIYLKISDDMTHLYIINQKKEMFCYNCDEYIKDNSIKGKKCSIHKSTIKVQCKYCRRLICEVCLENEANSSVGLCEECNMSNEWSFEKLTHDYK